jgi:hypothetical protein
VSQSEGERGSSHCPGRLPKSAGIPIAGALQPEAAAETKPNLGKFAAFVFSLHGVKAI